MLQWYVVGIEIVGAGVLVLFLVAGLSECWF